MAAKEIRAGVISLRIHDEMCQPLDDIHTASISHIVSEAYRKRSLPSPPTTGNASSTPQ